MTNITSLTLSELVKNIKDKKLSSEETTKAYIERGEKSQDLNTYITEDFSNALKKSKIFDQKPNFDLKLPGVPMAVKDLFCTNGVKTTAGSKMLKISFQHMSQQSLKIFGTKVPFYLVS